MNSAVITKSNMLIEASYRLSLNEHRIILYGISLINPIAKEFPLEYRIEISRFAEFFNIDSDGLYSDIKASVVKKFWQREFTYQLEKNGKKRLCRWLEAIEYDDDSGYIKVFFSHRVKPFLYQLQKNFTTYYINQIANFKSVSSVRIYEICIMNYNRYKDAFINKTRHFVSFKISIEQLKNRLELDNKYKRFCDFNDRVLMVATKEINKYSNIKISYKVIRTGQTPHELIFKITKKNNETSTQKLSLLNKIRDLKTKIDEYKCGVNSTMAKMHKSYRLEQEKLLNESQVELKRLEKILEIADPQIEN